MKHPPRITWYSGWNGYARRQPELEAALFAIGEELVGERGLERIVQDYRDRAVLNDLDECERSDLERMGAGALLDDIRGGSDE